MSYPPPPQQPDPDQGAEPREGAYPPPPGSYPPPPAGAYPPPPAGAYPPAGSNPPPPGGYPQGGYPPGGYAQQPGGYPPAAPAYGAYPPGPPEYAPPKKRRRWPWIVGGTVLVVVVALVIVGIVFGRTGSSDPHTAVDRFWSALAQHDQKKAEQYVCSNKNLKANANFTQLVDGLHGYDIGSESGSGGKRVYPVTAHLTINGQTGDLTIDTTVTKSAGKWYVCDLAPH